MRKILVITTLCLLASAAGAHAADAKTNWDKNCVKCHGAKGDGDTKMGKKLGIKDYTDPKVQAEMKDEEMAKIIKEGKKENGRTKMKAFGGVLTDAEIKELVAYVRGLKK